MSKEKITVYGDSRDIVTIGTFTRKCAEEMKLTSEGLAVFTEGADAVSVPEGVGIAVCPEDMRDRLRGVGKIVTYSVNNSMSDITALNIQRRENCSCFELLCKPFMGRVYIPNGVDFTAKQILVSSAVLYALGGEGAGIVDTVNAMLKEEL